MRMIRLFLEVPLRPGCEVELTPAAAAHAVRVLRLRAGDAVTLFNGDGNEYPATLVPSGARELRAAIESVAAPVQESSLHITLLQAIARGEKMDWIVQKATELGVVRVAPVSTRRSEVRLDEPRAGKRLEHWRAVAVAACEQCGRNIVPVIDAPAELSTRLGDVAAPGSDAGWMLVPGNATRLRDVQPGAGTLTLAVGPEGGFDETDLAILRTHGFRELALGPRILRTETAGVAAIAALQALYGDL